MKNHAKIMYVQKGHIKWCTVAQKELTAIFSCKYLLCQMRRY